MRSAGPVFTDSSGRRRRAMRVAGLAAAVLLVVCLGAVVIAMTGGPKAPFTQWAAPQSQAPAPAGNQGQQAAGHSRGKGRTGGSQPGGGTGGQPPGGGTQPAATAPAAGGSPSQQPAPSSGASPSATATATSSPAPTNHAGKTPPGHTKSPNPRKSSSVA